MHGLVCMPVHTNTANTHHTRSHHWMAMLSRTHACSQGCECELTSLCFRTYLLYLLSKNSKFDRQENYCYINCWKLWYYSKNDLLKILCHWIWSRREGCARMGEQTLGVCIQIFRNNLSFSHCFKAIKPNVRSKHWRSDDWQAYCVDPCLEVQTQFSIIRTSLSFSASGKRLKHQGSIS